jgi:3-methyl-2-oxobutanoate hydroxymethyltransferase
MLAGDGGDSVRVTIQQIQEKKQRGERFAMLTAYDYAMAKLVDEIGMPILLVGDSLGTVVLGHETTLPVTMEDIIRCTQAVVRGSRQAMIVADLPFMSYQVSPEQAVQNAGRLMQEGGAQAVKLEGGAAIVPTVQRIVAAGIPVMGHLGLTPQSVHQLGGYRVQGRTAEVASQLLADAAALEAAGAFSIVLECVPAQLAGEISRRIHIPTIGIGAGPECDGQVQVIYDLLGLFTDFTPRHARHYAELGEAIKSAVRQYADDVTAGSFPTKAQSFSMNETVLQSIYGPAPDQTPAATP